MRIETDGAHYEFKYVKEGYHSQATSILELPNHNLFVTGNLYGETDDYVMVLVLDKQLNLLGERQYEKEVDAVSFMECKATLDCHGHVIVATAVKQHNNYQGFDLHGVFLKFDEHGDLISHRYLIEDYPNPLFYFMDFRMRQMWYKEESETLLCLSTGGGGVLSFVTFDSAFNYIEEHPIWRDSITKSDHTIFRGDCYIDHWYNEDEALVFSSYGDYLHNKLRVSKINTRGEILEMIRLNERADTIDDTALHRCMAAANDSTFYFTFYYHTWTYYPGVACVYQLNEQLDIVGRHLDDDHESYWTNLILPTSDNGCITVNDSSSHTLGGYVRHPVISKLTPDDFESVFWSVDEKNTPSKRTSSQGYPNPTSDFLNIPITWDQPGEMRCRITDARGRVVTDRPVFINGRLLQLDVSKLKSGLYQCQIYSTQRTFLTERFIKK